MRLKSIKLAGFKSFVDPTTVNFPGNLSAVVGPNGCGKSNIIDAVRWVMGESSAKTLRGESMTDVIFSGSNSRMPVGQASIELIFDNSDGSLKGEYGSYTEISIRRTVTRELQSIYYLNGGRCRRRDIQDIFLGTGLGPRSYSIIEQGMISRFIEAKPEEMRVYIEEAAGISKYKERRRETENRMRHTKENLERLTDIREELERQLQHLKRQARAAEQYSEFKQDERRLKAELQAIRWRNLDQEYSEQERNISEQEVELEAAHAQQRAVETDIEKMRQQHVGANENFQQLQGKLYEVGTGIARYEQNIQHQQERSSQLEEDLTATLQLWHEANADLEKDQERIEQLNAELATVEPELAEFSAKEEVSSAALESADAAMNQWQQAWEEFQQKASVPRQRAEVEQSRIQQLERVIDTLQQRITKLEAENQGLSVNAEDAGIAELEAQAEAVDQRAEQQRQRVEELVGAIEQQRQRNQELSHALDQARRKMQELQGRFASLEALQQAALGQKDTPVLNWLQQHRLDKQPRLAQNLKVKRGWETAVEVVLGHHLQAVCIDKITDFGADLGAALEALPQGSVTLISRELGLPQKNAEHTPLLSKVVSDWNLESLLAGVFVADDLEEALAMRATLEPQESVVTRAGVWLGSGWMRVSREIDEQSSVLERQEELNQLQMQLSVLDEQIESQGVDHDAGLLKLKNSEEARESAQDELNQLQRQHAEIGSELSAKRARIEQLTMRKQRMMNDLEEGQQQLQQEQESLAQARELWQQSLASVEQDAGERETLMLQRESLRAALEQARTQARHDKDLAHQSALRKQSITTQLDALNQGLERLKAQVDSLSQRQTSLQDTLESNTAPIAELQQALEQELEKRVALEEELTQSRQALEKIESDLNQLEQQRIKSERKVEGVRGQLEQSKLQWQGTRVQRATIETQLDEAKQDLKALLESLAANAEASDAVSDAVSKWERQIERTQNRIQRLGPINLAAIDEYKTQSERKVYLDEQNQDLEEALETLENAIRKIDRETRTRFKETFDQVNKGFQEIFPKVFGGGHAYLELTGDDLLDTGVTVMARPPGKRNSTIHLLSGGEKALTAISMVFSIFQLNPAPFCMLDEVDAPLDDANVGRFCRIVEEMSETVQFIYITHNKITMEMANYMMGVTMQEPGVSRLVSVNIDEAAEMAAV